MTMHSLSGLMDALSQEMESLAAAAEDLHWGVCGAPMGQGEQKADLMRAAQGIDSAQQTLANLSEFLRLLAQEMPPEWRMDVGEPCRRSG